MGACEWVDMFELTEQGPKTLLDNRSEAWIKSITKVVNQFPNYYGDNLSQKFMKSL